MKVVKIISILIAPSGLWISVTALGFWAQSLSNMIEIPIVLFVSILLSCFSKKIGYKWVMLISFVFVILLRYFMPLIPE